MSISNIRSSFEKKGCQITMVIIGILVAVGLLMPGTCNTPRAQEASGPVIAEVQGKAVSYSEIDTAVKRMTAQNPQAAASDPVQQFDLYARSLVEAISSAAIDSLAAQRNVSVSDEQAKKIIEDELSEANLLNMVKMEFLFSGKVKPNATDKEYMDAFQSTYGQSLADYRKQRLDEVMAAMADPVRKPAVVRAALTQALRQAYENAVAATEADVKASYDTLVLRRLQFGDAKLSEGERQKRAEAAQKDLSAGMSFAEAKKKHKADDASSDSVTYRRSILEDDPVLTPLLKLRPNDVTDVINEGGSHVVYQLVKLGSDLPKDFEQRKADLLTSYKKQKADKAFNDDIAKVRESAVTWKSDGWKVMFDVYTAMSTRQPSTTVQDDVAKFRELASRAKTIEGTSDPGAYAAGLAWIAASEMYFQMLPPEERNKPEEQEARIEVLERALEDYENFQRRDELLALYLKMDRKDDAFATLLTSAQNLGGDFGPLGELHAKSVAEQVNKAEDAKTFTAEQIAQIRKELQRYAEAKVQFAREEKEAQAEQERIAKELDEADKKAEEQEKSATKPKGQ